MILVVALLSLACVSREGTSAPAPASTDEAKIQKIEIEHVIPRRDAVGPEVVEPWLSRLTERARPDFDRDDDPYTVAGNVQPYLRALHLQLALAPRPPAHRADLLLTLIDRLKSANPNFLT